MDKDAFKEAFGDDMTINDANKALGRAFEPWVREGAYPDARTIGDVVKAMAEQSTQGEDTPNDQV